MQETFYHYDLTFYTVPDILPLAFYRGGLIVNKVVVYARVPQLTGEELQYLKEEQGFTTTQALVLAIHDFVSALRKSGTREEAKESGTAVEE